MDKEAVRRYLESRFQGRIEVTGLVALGGKSPADPKGYGYGEPIRVDFTVDGAPRVGVLETVKPGGFGHETMADRAQVLLLEHLSFDKLPRHVKSLDIGGFADGHLVSLGHVQEFFGLREFAPGREYVKDLERLAQGADATALDLARADALCDYLIQIHSRKGGEPGLYVRRVRELVGHGECIMGVLDAYPSDDPLATPAALEAIERSCVRWRWQLKPLVHRLAQVHGDFHPWNILFREGTDFSLLDRSRGEWGEPADDVATLTMNYLFFGLAESGLAEERRFGGGLRTLFDRFWARYLAGSGDGQLPDVVPPFMAFRALVMACPVWYPRLAPGVRTRLLRFAQAVLDSGRFEPGRVDALLAVEP